MNKLIISVSPHLKGNFSTTKIMLDVLIALIPALVASVFLFGLRALLLIAVCVTASVLAEFLFEKAIKRPVTVSDLTAVITGILLAFNLPVSIPVWQAVFGSVVAIIVVKQLFGGVGMNFANPAITARIILLVSFGTSMTNWVAPDAIGLLNINTADLTTSATPLAELSSRLGTMPSVTDMLIGNRNGCLGETCSIALIVGGIYLVARKVITYHIPVFFIGTVFVLSLILAPSELAYGLTNLDYAIYAVLSGGVLLAAIFMATDYVTSPVTSKGKIIFGIGCGLITFIIRRYGALPEGVSYAVLLMNILTPYINRWTPSKPFGGVK